MTLNQPYKKKKPSVLRAVLFHRPKTATSSKKPHPALQIPEILERIFSYLSPYQLDFSVSPVNRVWYEASRSCASKITHWKGVVYADMEAVLQRTDVLKVDGTRMGLLEDSLRKVKVKELETVEVAGSRRKRRRIRSFMVECSRVSSSFDWSLLALMNGLTCLWIRTTTLACFPLRFVLEVVPELEDFVLLNCPMINYVSKCHLTTLGGDSWGRGRPLLSTRLAKQYGPDGDEEAPLTWLVRTRLRKVWFEGISINVQTMYSLVRASPMLEDFKMVEGTDLLSPIGSTGTGLSKRQVYPDFDRTLLVSLLGVHCRRLSSVVIAPKIVPFSLEEASVLFGSFPKLEGWGGLAKDFDTLMPSIQTRLNHLTTLELYSRKQCRERHEIQVLHEYLCASPQLLHLRAPSVIFYHRDLDPSASIASDGSNTIHRKLWACRRLQTLHLSFTLPRNSSTTADKETMTTRTQEQSRMTFAYLTFVCPLLEDIQLRFTDLNLSLEGGWCLFSRLTRLEKLILFTGSNDGGGAAADKEEEEKELTKEDLVWIAGRDEKASPFHLLALRKIKKRLLKSKKGRGWARQGQGSNTSEGMMLTIMTMKDSNIWRLIDRAGMTLHGILDVLDTLDLQERFLGRGRYCFWPRLEEFWVEMVGKGMSNLALRRLRQDLKSHGQRPQSVWDPLNSFVVYG